MWVTVLSWRPISIQTTVFQQLEVHHVCDIDWASNTRAASLFYSRWRAEPSQKETSDRSDCVSEMIYCLLHRQTEKCLRNRWQPPAAFGDISAASLSHFNRCSLYLLSTWLVVRGGFATSNQLFAFRMASTQSVNPFIHIALNKTNILNNWRCTYYSFSLDKS